MAKPTADIGLISQKINNCIVDLYNLQREIDRFVESDELATAEMEYERNLKIAIEALEHQGAKQSTLIQKAKGDIAETYGFRLKKAEIKKWAMDKRLETYRTIISARKEQYKVQDEI